jgi:AMMECR1 domain-containing protein
MPQLSNHVTLLTNFSQPTKDPLDWTLGVHGIRISFSYHTRRFGATYLPDVAKEQGWTKDETLVSLMRKAGWNGSSRDWQKVWRDGKGELVRYEGKAVGLNYDEWKAWRDWVERAGVKAKALN